MIVRTLCEIWTKTTSLLRAGRRFDPGGGTGNLGSEGLPNSDRRMSTSARPPAPLRADRRREGTQVVLDLHVEPLPFKHDHETAAAAGVRDLERAADAGNGGFEGGIPHRLQLNGRHPAPGTRHPAPGTRTRMPDASASPSYATRRGTNVAIQNGYGEKRLRRPCLEPLMLLAARGQDQAVSRP